MSDLGNKNVFAKNLKKYMELHNIDRSQLCSILGFKYSTVCEWLSANKYPRIDKIEILANFFGIQKSDLIEENKYYSGEDIYNYDNIIPMPKTKKIPLVGTIACGEPVLAIENIENYISIPEDINADFALRCKGDSMTEVRINDGDIVYIRRQPTVNNGEIAAVLIEDEATLKKVYLSEGTIKLIACNSSYEPFIYTGEELNRIRILGKAVGFTSKI